LREDQLLNLSSLLKELNEAVDLFDLLHHPFYALRPPLMNPLAYMREQGLPAARIVVVQQVPKAHEVSKGDRGEVLGHLEDLVYFLEQPHEEVEVAFYFTMGDLLDVDLIYELDELAKSDGEVLAGCLALDCFDNIIYLRVDLLPFTFALEGWRTLRGRRLLLLLSLGPFFLSRLGCLGLPPERSDLACL